MGVRWQDSRGEGGKEAFVVKRRYDLGLQTKPISERLDTMILDRP